MQHMKTQVYLVRHIESEGNICRRNDAQFDCISTRKGLMQAEVLADRFDGIHVDALYSSDIRRSIDTALPISRRKNLPIRLRRLLREYTIGCWEGTSIGDTARAYPEMWDIWCNEPWNHRIPGADPFEIVADRGIWIIREMARENPGKTVVAITHSCTLVCTLCRLMGKPMSFYKNVDSGDNTAVTLVEVDENGNIEIGFVSDISHLPDDLRRSDYTGRTLDQVFAFDTVTDRNMEAFRQMYSAWCASKGTAFTEEGAAKLLERTKDNPRRVLLPALPGRNCGIFAVRDDENLPSDHGLMDVFYMTEDISNRGNAAQAFGEGFDTLRREGKRYVVLKDDGTRFFDFFFDRFLFEDMPGMPGYKRVRITVPGVEGPVY